jgi:D-inositol-3-phosphate glycosyltransferase
MAKQLNLQSPSSASPTFRREIAVTLLTGGGDKPYALGLATALASKGVHLDVIGSDQVESPEFHKHTAIRFLNLRGRQDSGASLPRKVLRVAAYYVRLILYAAGAEPQVFHILWNNKVELFDRTLLMLYYRSLGKKIVFTAHNVNAARRDSTDTILNRVTLRIQYWLCHHLFVHTKQMQQELGAEFGVPADKITVIPFGINNTASDTQMSGVEARRLLRIGERAKIILFFGNIAPYKGVEYLVDAFQQIVTRSDSYHLVIAGRCKDCQEYWHTIQDATLELVKRNKVTLRPEFVPDDQIEVFFKAADVLVLPYRHVYQSGVLFLALNFGLPVLAADVGSLRDDIVERESGFVFKPEDPVDLARALEEYFASSLYTNLDRTRQDIRRKAKQYHSWDIAAEATESVYAQFAQSASGKACHAGVGALSSK